MTGRSRHSTPFRVLRGIAGAIVALLLLPYVIAPLYRFVDPVSALMLWRRLESGASAKFPH